MKKHAIIPIFIPHEGCPNDCVFCNQKIITAKSKPLKKEDIIGMIDRYLETLIGRSLETIEIAFFGGSFTGIPIEQQTEYLTIAKKYKDRGLIQKIHLSTRPDYINQKILDNLKNHDVDIIELGVQSFDEEVLRLSNRGHGKKIVYQSSELIQRYGFTLGLQLMIGLPGDTYEKSVFSAREAVKIGPSIARLYPTIIIQNTELYRMYQDGNYTPLSTAEAVRTAKDMYLILRDAGINVIRIGLKSSDYINENGDIAGGTFHPAFRQLVESEIAKEQLESQITPMMSRGADHILFCCNQNSVSNMIGNRKSNRIYFEKKYPHVRFTFHVDNSLPDNAYWARVSYMCYHLSHR